MSDREADRSEILIEDAVLAGGFVQIPTGVQFDPDLSAGAKVAYAALLWYAWRLGEFPGQQVMGQDLGMGERTVRRHLADLEQKGYIEVQQLGLGRPNRYVVKSLQGRSFPDRPKMAGLGGQNRPVSPAKNGRSIKELDSKELDLNDEDERPPAGGSVSLLASQVGERYGRNPRDAKALATSLSRYPEEALTWAVEELETRSNGIANRGAWLNAVVPALAEQLEERKREQMSQKQQRRVMIHSTAYFYAQVDGPDSVRRRLRADFRQAGDTELVEEVMQRLEAESG